MSMTSRRAAVLLMALAIGALPVAHAQSQDLQPNETFALFDAGEGTIQELGCLPQSMHQPEIDYGAAYSVFLAVSSQPGVTENAAMRAMQCRVIAEYPTHN